MATIGQARLRPRVLLPSRARDGTFINTHPCPLSRSLMQKGPIPRPSRRRRRKRRSLGIMAKLQDHTIYTRDNQIANFAEHQGMHVHLITGPTQHVLRDAHTVYLFGSHPPLDDTGDTEHVTQLASSLGQDVFLCDVTSGQWYKRAPNDPSFTHLHSSTFPVLHPRSAVLVASSLPLHHLQLISLFQRTQDTLSP